MDKMRASRFNEPGGPEALQFDVAEIPKPVGNNVFFKVRVFALNQAGVLFINGYHDTQPVFPSRMGSEANCAMHQDSWQEGKSYVMNKIDHDRLEPLVDRVFPFEQTVEASRYMLSGKHKEKMVVRIQK